MNTHTERYMYIYINYLFKKKITQYIHIYEEPQVAGGK